MAKKDGGGSGSRGRKRAGAEGRDMAPARSETPSPGDPRTTSVAATDLHTRAAAHLKRLEQGPQVAEVPSAVNVGLATHRRANTIIYVHGIGNKPIPSVLKCQWDHALFASLPPDTDLGERSRLAYWVNREYYPTPTPGSCGGADRVTEDLEEAAGPNVLAADDDAVRREIDTLTSNAGERTLLARLADRLEDVVDADDDTAARFAALQVTAKILPLPRFIRRRITRQLTRRLLRDVHDFFYRPERRDLMRRSVIERIEAGSGPFVVIGHSQGSMIAYDVLRTLSKQQAEVVLFVTIGSPLGLAEVQDVLTDKDFANTKNLPFPPCVDQWVNVADRLDPVAADTGLANEFPAWKPIIDYRGFGLNPDSPRHPHSGSGYLSTRQVRTHVSAAMGTEFRQPIVDFAIARDLVAELEDGGDEATHEVLIELRTPADETQADLERAHDERVRAAAKARGAAKAAAAVADSPAPPAAKAKTTGPVPLVMDQRRQRLVEALRKMAESGNAKRDTAKRDLAIEEMRRFVSARLTRREVEALRQRYNDLQIHTVWRDAAKRALIDKSTHTVQARPANRGYGATGEGIHWAVLDTGVWRDHPHFERYGNIVSQWDCTARGPVVPWKPTDKHPRLDGNGHGTHVAGIIAGAQRFDLRGNDIDPLDLEGMAPRAKLHVYKVLRDDGTGSDSFIIKALDHITGENEREPELVIHGINLSLGGSFDPTVYGAGHSPLCRELRRLWGQGVLIVIAAGNEGRASVAGERGMIDLNVDLSISDPANLEEAIAVGSVHKSNPHTYGITYFSSRGPTADGRLKPDLVAPGERIRSAYHLAAEGDPTIAGSYVEMSGTSMAAPHVSGVLAAFLSRRREFIGYPDRVKKILLDNCTDLGRERFFQGHGMPNLIQMLANS